MTLLHGRYQPLDARRAGAPQRVRDLQTAQTVLLREVSVPAPDVGQALTRARAAVGVFHPSLITLFDVVHEAGGHIVLAYEFVPAQTLLQVGGGHPFHARRAAEIVADIADAVAELHARDIVHGAITAETVLVTMKGRARLDRVGDPSLLQVPPPVAEEDLRALGQLLSHLTAPASGSGIPGAQAIEVIVCRARDGRFASAAAMAAMLRRL